MYEKSIIYRLIFELGCPVFSIAKTLGTSEAEVYRILNGEKISSESEKK
jgi:DNA invertase Pin-like site-specific DNA recombinase